MSELKIFQEWESPDPDYQATATIEIECQVAPDGKEKTTLEFEALEAASQVVETTDDETVCFITNRTDEFNSDLETETSCEQAIIVTQAGAECEFLTTVFPYTAVPATGAAGLAFLITAMAAFAVHKLKQPAL